MMRKFLLLLITVGLVSMMVACGTQNNDNNVNASGPEENKNNSNTSDKEEFTDQPSKEGYYVIKELGNDSYLVVAAEAKDFSSNGGDPEFYEMITFSKVPEKLKVGQRVIIEVDGAVAESYPAQAKAKSVKFLPVYKPENADLNETQVVRVALETVKDTQDFIAITNVEFNEEEDKWTVGIRIGFDEYKDIDVLDQAEEQ